MDVTYIGLYIDYLNKQQKKSKNTLEAYKRDILEFYRYLEKNGMKDISELANADVVAFMMKLRADGRSGPTLNRKMASLRSYTSFLRREGVLTSDPCENIKPPRVEKRNVDFLTIEETKALLDAPDDSPRGIRDRALLEVLYGSGIRVTEAADLSMKDVNLRIGFIMCSGGYSRARIIPLGRPCRNALENYLTNVRPGLISQRGGDEKDGCDYVFVNMRGEKLTRQGLWKIVKKYAGAAGIEECLTPQILRNSFAVHMLQNGADLKSVQELMGYEDAAALSIYMGATRSRIKEVYDRTHPRA